MTTEQGLQSPSFERAARLFAQAEGEPLCADSVRRVTEGFGEQVRSGRAAEVAQVYALTPGAGAPSAALPQVVQPLEGTVNLSSDGTMIRIRGEGWKEVKLTVLSQVLACLEQSPADAAEGEAQAAVRLCQHSCQAGLWEADTLGRYQYTEGLRRGLHEGQRLSSVNDGAAWIERITAENYPQAVQIVDWTHAKGHLSQVAQEVFGENSPAGTSWVAAQKKVLWPGGALQVAEAIGALPAPAEVVRQAQGYFQSNHHRMQYAQYRAAGYPTGSGTVESGGLNYVQYRLKRPGPGWNRNKAQSMLAALSELHSNRLDLAWKQFARPTNLR